MDKQIKKTIIDMENNQNTQISSSNGNTLNRIQLPNYDDEKNDNNKNRSNLTFKSNYINYSGKWTRKAVDDGFVKFDDYIGDIENTEDTFPSYNNKQFKITKASPTNNNSNNLNNSYDHGSNPTFEKLGLYSGIKGIVDSGTDWFKDRYKRFDWIEDNMGMKVAISAGKDGNDSLKQAEKKAKEWGLDGVWNNKADAYRHFIWNVKLTRNDNVGYYNSRNITNNHEYDFMKEKGWISKDSEDFNYLKDNTKIRGRMNQENFMDLWNNQVGRELANNKEFKNMSEEELFDFAINNKLLITDANTVYDFLGITDYIVDLSTYTVDVEWDLTTGNITVFKDNKSVTLKIGI